MLKGKKVNNYIFENSRKFFKCLIRKDIIQMTQARNEENWGLTNASM